jgi:hypothetical protein
MRKRLFAGAAVTALAALMPLNATAPLKGGEINWSMAQAQEASVNISFFFDSLAPHGKWSRHGKYGYVFIPAVDRDWAPYKNGRWIWTEEHGWYWQSDEPFAWAVYHYGRWFYVAEVGWVWVPGTKWGPAWVSWRKSDDYVGWAPLPPVRDGYVVDVDVDVDVDIDISYWHFVEAPRFLEPDLVVVIIDARERPEIYERTEFVGTVKVENNIVINNVIDIDYVEEETKQEVTVHKVEAVEKPDAVAVEADSVQVFKPEISPETDKEPAETVELKEGTPPAAAGAATDAPAPTTETQTTPETPATTSEPPAEQRTPTTETPAQAPAVEPQETSPTQQSGETPKPGSSEQPSEMQAQPPAQTTEPEQQPAEVKPAQPEQGAQEEPQQQKQPPDAATTEPKPDQAPEAKPSKEGQEEKAKEEAPKECTPEMLAAGTCQ